MRIIIMLLLLGGCTYNVPVTTPITDGISRQEVDAINAEAACKRMARNLVEISRCEVRQ
jgi:hypothetical protein